MLKSEMSTQPIHITKEACLEIAQDVEKGFRRYGISVSTSSDIAYLIQEFIGDDPHGAVIAFQKDSYLGVKDYKSQEHLMAEDGKWCVFKARCSCSDVRLFRMPITRYTLAYWYVKFLRQVRDYILGE